MKTYFFYDLETTGLSPAFDRTMQFAGIRVDENFDEVGQRVNILVKTTDDILPSPGAIMVTGITPQQTLADGLTEAEFAKFLQKEVFTPDTTVVGFNNIRFDDRFLQNTFWRSFYDPYAWQWQDGRSKWDILDAVRLVRALRPEGINWPFVDAEKEVEKDGKKVKEKFKKPANKLELLTVENNLPHIKAHDALSDVEATINVAKLLREKQPKIFNYLLENHDKKSIQKLVNLENPQPIVYASGRYYGLHADATTVVLPIAPGKNANEVLVYDLTNDITKWNDDERFPFKILAYNRCPAVAPVGVLDEKTQKRLKLPLNKIQENLTKLKNNRGILDKLIAKWEERPEYEISPDIEGQLYSGGFLSNLDSSRAANITNMTENELADYHPKFDDERMSELLFRYKARNFPKSLSEDEQAKWQKYRTDKFNANIENYMNELAELSKEGKDDFLLQELQLWAESIYPGEE